MLHTFISRSNQATKLNKLSAGSSSYGSKIVIGVNVNEECGVHIPEYRQEKEVALDEDNFKIF